MESRPKTRPTPGKTGGLIGVVILAMGMTLAPAAGWAAPGTDDANPAAPGQNQSAPGQASGTSPTTGNGQISVNGDGWISYPSVLEQAGIGGSAAHLSTINLKGTKTADGCMFSDSITSDDLAAGARSDIYMTEVGYNPKSCQSRLIAAQVTPEQLARIAQLTQATDSTGASSETLTDAPVINPSVSPLTRDTPYQRTLKAMIKDPIGLVTTSTTTTLYWTATSSSVKSYGITHSYSWLSTTGWYRYSYSQPGGAIGNWTSVYGDTIATYWNNAFCKALFGVNQPATWDTHSKTRVEGRPGGGWTWGYSMSKSGGCSGMLHYDYSLS